MNDKLNVIRSPWTCWCTLEFSDQLALTRHLETHDEPAPPIDHLANAVRRMEDAQAAIRAAYIFEADPLMTELLTGCCERANKLFFDLQRYDALRRAKL